MCGVAGNVRYLAAARVDAGWPPMGILTLHPSYKIPIIGMRFFSDERKAYSAAEPQPEFGISRANPVLSESKDAKTGKDNFLPERGVFAPLQELTSGSLTLRTLRLLCIFPLIISRHDLTKIR